MHNRRSHVPRRRRRCRGLLALVVFGLAAGTLAAQGTRGTEFWGGMMYNVNITGTLAQYLVYLSSRVNTTGTVSIPRTGWTQNFSVPANGGVVLVLPDTLLMSFGSEGAENKGFRITTLDSVEAYSLNYLPKNADGSILLPVGTLGTDYRVMTYIGAPPDGVLQPSMFQITAVTNGTRIEITPSAVTVGLNPIGVPFTVTLQAGQVFQVLSEGDLTGTRVRSLNNQSFALSSGCVRAYVPLGVLHTDHLYEQLYPVEHWGATFVTVPLAGRTADTYRVLAATDSTVVTVTGMASFTLNAGQFREFMLSNPSIISASEPVEVAQFSNGSDFDFANFGDPAMTIVSPADFVRHDLKFFCHSKTNLRKHYLNISTISDGLDQIFLDGVSIQASFQAVTADPFYSWARIEVTTGEHHLTSYWGVNAYVSDVGAEEAILFGTGADNFIPCPSPSITPLGDTVFCRGDSVTLDAGAGYTTYLWSSGETSRTITVTASGIYSVVTLDANGCRRPSRPVRVTASSLPQPTIASVPGDTICPCDSAVLTAPAGYAYRWSTGETSQSIIARAAGSYDVVVTDTLGCAGSASASIAIETVTPTIVAGSGEGAPGNVVRVPITVAGTPALARCGLTAYTVVLRFNRRLLRMTTLSGASIVDQRTEGANEVMTLRGVRSGDTLAVLELGVALSDVLTSAITVDSVRWEQCSTVASDTLGGAFLLTGICMIGGPRLIAVGDSVALKMVHPNPATSAATVSVVLSEAGDCDISIVDLRGTTVATLARGVMRPGKYDLDINVAGLEQGRYMIVLATPTQRFATPLEVVR